VNDDSPLQFPCDFPIKVMGVGGCGFQVLVLELVRRHAPDLDATRVRIRDSRAGRYQSVTVTVNARDRAQLDAIYQDLGEHPRIKLVL
jgi:putative lipoic acid-binding regulatory protein